MKNNELGFLYFACSDIRPSVISQIGYIPEYMDALRNLKNDGVYIDSQTVFQTVKDVYHMVFENNKGNSKYRSARQIMNKLSSDLYGDPHAWQYK